MTQANQDYYACTLAIPAGYVDVPAHDEPAPPTTIYSTSFQDTSGNFITDGWVNVAQGSVGRGGAGWAAGPVGLSSATVTYTKTLTGLTVGNSYTFTVYMWSFNTVSAWVGVSGIGHSDATNTTQGFSPRTYTFTATATSHVLQVFNAGGDPLYFDDPSVTTPAPPVHVPDHYAYSASLNVADGSLKLTSTETPRISGSVTVGFPGSIDVLNAMDPDLKPRISLTIERWDVDYNYSTLPVDVLITDRVLNHNEGTVELTFASDEAQLQTYSVLAPDTTALTRQTSVRSIVNGVLSKFGASLTSRTKVTRTNLAKNPNFETNTTNWTTEGGATLTRDTTSPITGTASGLLTSGTANAGDCYTSATVNAGDTITFSLDIQTVGTLTGSPRIYINTPGSGSKYFYLPLTVSTATRYSITQTATTSGTAILAIFTGSTVGNAIRFDNVLIEKSATAGTYFDGNTAVNGANSYAWTGTVNGSSSTETFTDPAMPDPSFKVLESATNLVPNPSFETGVTNMAAGSGTSAIAQSNTYAFVGTYSCRWTSNTTGTSTVNGPGVAITAGKTYTFSLYVRSSVARSMRVLYRWYTGTGATGTQVGADAATPNVTDTTTGWTRIVYTVTAPATAVWLSLYTQAVSGASGDNHYVDGIMVVEGDGKDTDGVTDMPYFDGSTADGAAGTADYSYDWTGTPHLSTSTRTPLIDRGTDVLRWDVGDSAWDFLEPVLSTLGLYLWVDGARNWYLTDGTYTVPGLYTIAVGDNLYSAKDTMSLTAKGLDGQPIVPDGVVCNYTWLDSNGVNQWARDSAGAEGVVAVYDFNRPYPGPGTAQNILDKSKGRGRVLDITARPDLSPRPYQTVSITPPFADAQVGVITSVEWNFGADEMTVTTAGLVSTPANAWLFVPSSRTWSNTPNVAWTNYSN